jgi:hypothetical protein
MFLAHVPPGLEHVDDIRWENGTLIIEDHGANKTLRLAMANPI